MLKVEQLRYLKQLCNDAPDAVWALLRRDESYLALLRDALAWLYVRVRATCTLPDPACNWQVWVDLIRDRPSLFTGYNHRAKGLEQCRITCYAALQALAHLLQQFSCGQACDADPEDLSFPEACLICRRGFKSRSAWARSSVLGAGNSSQIAPDCGDTSCTLLGVGSAGGLSFLTALIDPPGPTRQRLLSRLPVSILAPARALTRPHTAKGCLMPSRDSSVRLRKRFGRRLLSLSSRWRRCVLLSIFGKVTLGTK